MTDTGKKPAFNARSPLWICLLLVVGILAVYVQVNTFEFSNYDTGYYIYENRHVKAGLTADSVRWAFTTLHGSNWFPLTWLSHMLDVELYGLEPGRHHMSNVLFHITNVLLLFGILMRMTGNLWRSSFVAALFALHPIHVQSVAWIAERKDVLSTFFGLLAVWSYLRYAKCSGIGRFLLVLLFFILGLMAKPMIVTLPFVLLLLDYWPLQRFQFGISKAGLNHAKQKYSRIFLIVEKIPLLLFSAASCLMTFYAQNIGGAVRSLDVFPLHVRITNALVSYIGYIAKMFWPVKLAVIYPHPGLLPMWQIIGSCLLITGITYFAIKLIQSRPWFIVGWLWYLGTLVPVIGLVQVGMQAMADRYTYIPLIGLYIVVAWGLYDLLARWRYQNLNYAIIAATIVSVLAAGSWKQIGYWKNSVALFNRALEVTEKNYVAHNNLGTGLVRQGRVAEATEHFKKSVEISPRFAIAHLNLGLALQEQNRLEEALQSFSRALLASPDFASAYNGIGKTQYRLGKPDQAVPNFLKAIRLDPDYAEAYNNLGISLYHLSRPDQALPYYLKAIRINHNYAEAYNNAGAALVRMGETQKSVAFFKEAIRINPEYFDAQNNLKSTMAALQSRSRTN